MSDYQQNMTVNDLIAHLRRAAEAGHGDSLVTIGVYTLDEGIDLDARPDFPRAESTGYGRVSRNQRGEPDNVVRVIVENWH